MFSRRVGHRFNRGRLPARAVAEAGAFWYSPTSSVDSRAGFVSPLVEFEGLAAPEQEDVAQVAIAFEEGAAAGGLVIGAPVYLDVALTGTFAGGALAATGSVGGHAVEVAATLSGGALSGTVTVANGSHEEVRSFSATRGGGVSVADGWWVDSENGDDGNDGSSPDQALATIAGLPALSEGDTVYLARGSHWREELDTRVGVGPISLLAYGIGPRPILDATDPTLAADWSLEGGFSNVYTASIALDATSPASNSAVTVFDGGRMLSLVDTAAECEANPGTCVEITAQVSPAVLQIHPFNSLAPSTDGQIEVATRESGFDIVGGCTIRGIMARAGWGNHGPANVPYYADDDNATVDDCVSLWGAKHNWLVNSGTVSRSVGFGAHPGSESSSVWVLYRNNIPEHTGPTPVMEDCAAIVWGYQAVALNGNNITALYEHDGQDPVNFWPRIDLIECGAKNVGKWEGTHLYCVDSIVEDQTTGAGAFTCKQSGEVTRCRVYCRNAVGPSGVASAARAMHTVAGTIAVTDCIFDLNNPSGGPIYCDDGTVVVKRCVFRCNNTGKRAVFTDASNTPLIRWGNESGESGNGNVILANCNGISIANAATTSALLSSDGNVMRGTAGWKESTTAVNRAWSTYRSDQVLFDQNSYNTEPSYEVGTNGTTGRPTFVETAASQTARGFAAGPLASRPSASVQWVTPATYDAWVTFLGQLES